MNMSFIEKIGLVFQYMFSSFLSIEMFIFSLLLLLLLLFNLKRKNNIIAIGAIGVYLGFLIGIMITYSTYVKECIDSFVKSVMNYIYFPSPVAYFFIIVSVTVLMLISIFSKKMTNFKKVFNYCFFSILYFFFMSFVALAAYEGVNLSSTVELYKNEVILAIVQTSNFIFVFWILFTLFYKLYCFYKKKFD